MVKMSLENLCADCYTCGRTLLILEGIPDE